MAWKGYEEDKWSGKKSDKRWFPFSVDKHDVKKVNEVHEFDDTIPENLRKELFIKAMSIYLS